MAKILQDRLKIIDPATLKTLLDNDRVNLIDVREPSEHAREHIPGSILIPLSTFEPQAIPVNNKKLVLHCQSGNRSSQAAQKLFAAGVEEVTHLEGGLNAWKQQGYFTKINKKAPISIMRQVQIIAGSLILTGTLLSLISPWFLLLTGFVGSGLLFAGISNICAMARLLAKMPWNQQF
ncbi:rhodanese-like domain-containing protein [Oscillatoria salina]|uniref:rhodanese-like domain-containing protein n=1 Tax=Oscillatoria salina TaxID=331517 RepID=UPI0013BBFFDA|nr:rhodanese-like domain-containing protein [Oscillatoria salina]MBZ8180281.1 rhodanese-like domain-containing protein [Oscillatoria salina IIICB1]NET87757.1 rhodanese-like domain-containing protein [Kamptonema sp. SIO1D9]